jgi:hypothetical protein
MPDTLDNLDFTFVARSLIDLRSEIRQEFAQIRADFVKLDNRISSLTNDMAMLSTLECHAREAELQALFDLYRDLRL